MRRKTVYRAIEGIDREQLEQFQAGHAQAVLRRAHPRRAPSVREAARPLADDARVRGRPRHHRAPADGDRALQVVEPREAAGRPRPAPVRDAGRAPEAPARPRRRAGARPDGQGHRGPQGRHAVEVALLAHVRLAEQRAEAGRVRRRRWGRSASSARSSRAPCSAIRSGRLPKFADWAQARRSDPGMLTEWQVYRMFDARRGAWSTFQYLIRSRLEERGVHISPEGRVLPTT